MTRGQRRDGGDMFGPYRLDALLGRGGMGEVWRAHDTRKSRDVAVKVLRPGLADDPEYSRRFGRECAAASRLNSPNIIPIHDYGDVDGRLFLEMPLVVGTDLGVLIDQGGPLAPRRAVAIVAQVGRALEVAHAAGLVHRDVKPSNVLVVDAEGHDHAYLIDFGIARAVDGTRMSLPGAAIGTPAYMAPERFDGDGDHRGDVYALGCVLHETVTGDPPYEGSSPLVLMKAHLTASPPRPSALVPDLPSAFDVVVARSLAKSPDDRYGSALDLVVAARDALGHLPPTGRSVMSGPTEGLAGATADVATSPVDPRASLPEPPDRLRPPIRRPVLRPAVLLSALLVAALVAGTIVVVSTLRGPPPIDRVLAGHTESVNALATAELDGRPVLVSAGSDRSVRVWDPATGAPVGVPLVGHTDAVFALATGVLDGRPVAVSGSSDRSLRVWDLTTGAPVGRPLVGHTDTVDAVATSVLNGRPVVVSGGSDRTVRVWDLATGAPIGPPRTVHDEVVLAVATAVVNGRPVVVSGSSDRTVRVSDLATGAPIGPPLRGHASTVYAVATAVLAGRPVVVSGSDDRTLSVWDLSTGELVVPVMDGHAGTVFAVATGELDGRPAVVSGGSDGSVRVWRLITGRQLLMPLTGGDYIAGVAILEIDGYPVVAGGGGDRTIRVLPLD